jgi:hypothetical protein
LLAAACDQFWDKGYAATSLDELGTFPSQFGLDFQRTLPHLVRHGQTLEPVA